MILEAEELKNILFVLLLLFLERIEIKTILDIPIYQVHQFLNSCKKNSFFLDMKKKIGSNCSNFGM